MDIQDRCAMLGMTAAVRKGTLNSNLKGRTIGAAFFYLT